MQTSWVGRVLLWASPGIPTSPLTLPHQPLQGHEPAFKQPQAWQSHDPSEKTSSVVSPQAGEGQRESHTARRSWV